MGQIKFNLIARGQVVLEVEDRVLEQIRSGYLPEDLITTAIEEAESETNLTWELDLDYPYQIIEE